MAASFRMEDELVQRLKRYALANDVSASAVVREALMRHLDSPQHDAYVLDANLFGRHHSGTRGTTTLRSVERKAQVRERLHAKHAPKCSPSTQAR